MANLEHQTISKPRLYLDCDGVVVADKSFDASREYKVPTGWVSEGRMRQLGNLGIEKYWLTTWSKEAVDDLQARTGISIASNHIPHVDEASDGRNQYYDVHPIDWKLRAIVRHAIQEGPQPFIWLDDLIDEEIMETTEKAFKDVPKLLIAPDRHVGLQPVDFKKIYEFLEEQNRAMII